MEFWAVYRRASSLMVKHELGSNNSIFALTVQIGPGPSNITFGTSVHFIDPFSKPVVSKELSTFTLLHPGVLNVVANALPSRLILLIGNAFPSSSSRTSDPRFSALATPHITLPLALSSHQPHISLSTSPSTDQVVLRNRRLRAPHRHRCWHAINPQYTPGLYPNSRSGIINT